MKKSKLPSLDEIVDKLTRSAFEYFNLSIQQLDDSPKFAIVSFYSGIELLFKVRLAHEHWSLIAEKVDNTSIKEFLNGDFQSVGLKKANNRLNSLCEDGLSEKSVAYKSFDRLREHRNRIIHFYHDLSSQEDGYSAVSELLRSWYHASQLLNVKWKEKFLDYQNEFSDFNQKIHAKRDFLKTKFDQLKPDFESWKEAGNYIHSCPSCGFESLCGKSINSILNFGICKVCEFEDYHHHVHECECGESVKIVVGETGECEKCHRTHSFTEIIENMQRFVKPGDVDDASGHCSECDGYNTLIQTDNDNWLCSACGAEFSVEDIDQCEHCGDLNAHLPELSTLHGCRHCEGSYSKMPD